MKDILKNVCRPSRYVFITGIVVVAAFIIASTVLYIGAGCAFDYHTAIKLSENLLASARPVSVAVFVFSTGTEYCLRRKNNSDE